MNFQALQEEVWKNIGFPDTTTGTRTDARSQTIKDAINAAMFEVGATCAPSLDFLKRETTISVVAGTQDYLINDWCQRPLSIWTEGQYAHRIDLRRAIAADRDGSRNSLYVAGQLGPYQVTLLPRTTDASVSGIAASGTGATVAQGSKTVTFGSSSTSLTSAYEGRMLTLNGEDADYKIVTVSSAHVVVVDKPILARVRSTGTSLAGSGYAAASCSWEIGPAGRYKLRFLPVPTDTSTVYVRYMAYPRFLVGDSDRPELQNDMHQILVKGAMKSVAAGKQNTELYTLWQTEFERILKALRASDVDEYASDDTKEVETLDNMGGGRPVQQPGTYSRNWGSGYSSW